MGIQSALYSGVSGLNTNSQSMSIIGNNLANSNTLGFKGSRSVFSDLLSSNIVGSGGNSQVGRGVGLSIVDSVFSQGTMETTSSGTDVAIEGEGFFVLKETDENVTYYSRAGSFRFDAQGYLVNPEGLVVQGKLFDSVANDTLLPEDPKDIQVANVGLIEANPTTELTFNTNLNENSTEYGDGKMVPPATVPTAATMASLIINGTPVNGTATTIDGKVAEINALSATTGVSAIAGNMVAGAAVTTAPAAITAGDITINGTAIGAVAAGATNTEQAVNLAAAINLQSAVTGVTALVGSAANGGIPDSLILSNVNGQAIDVALAGTATLGSTGLTAATTAAGANPTITLFSNRGADAEIILGSVAPATDAPASIGLTNGTKTLTDNAVINPAGLIVPNDKTTFNYSVSSSIYDSLGDSHLVSVYWRMVDNETNTWDAAYTIDNGDPIAMDPNLLEFDEKGKLDIPKAVNIAIPASVWANGADDSFIKITFDCTQYDSASVVIGQEQNGFAAGELTKIAVNNDGVVQAAYSNGKKINIAQLVLAKFQNTGGLQLAGSNRYIATNEVGIIRVGPPGAELGKLFTNSLEQSNVDMGQEFVKMISTQRGFQANSKIITTVDEMLGELINLKR